MFKKHHNLKYNTLILCTFLFGPFLGLLQATEEIDLCEKTDTRPVFLIMYDPKLQGFKTSLTDARGSFPSYTHNIAGKNSLIMTLKAREKLELSHGNRVYKAAKDGEVLFGVLLGAAGTLATHTGPILLHKDFYWPEKKDKKGQESTTTVLACLRQWAGTLAIDGSGDLNQGALCAAIEEALQKKKEAV